MASITLSGRSPFDHASKGRMLRTTSSGTETPEAMRSTGVAKSAGL